ncbi:MAG TPA: ABC transporter permease [Gaiellaceae bacterium]|jgi:oligopeptide transport system permease protein|nr:ABC transporter permease [Gaiellaceae bacterium]
MAVREPTASARTPVASEAGTAAGAPLRQSSLWQDAWRRYIRNRGAVAAGAVFLLIILYAFLIPGFWIVPGIWTDLVNDIDPYDVDFSQAYQGASAAHPFGTDQFGRDLFARAALGGQVSIGIGFAATLVILVVAIVYGGISGFAGGALDNVLMRVLDALYGLPFLPFAIITLQIVGTVNFMTMVLALSIVSWFTDARVVRGQVITLKENDYVRAARAVGARWYRVLGRHILPNTLGILIISMFLSLPGVVLGEAFISFIGLGINPPNASWGAMANDGREAYRSHPLVLVVPSLFIAALVLSANFIADGLRDALDPRTRET